MSRVVVTLSLTVSEQDVPAVAGRLASTLGAALADGPSALSSAELRVLPLPEDDDDAEGDPR